MNNWKIYSLYYGEIEGTKEMITVGVDVGLKVAMPYLGFLLDNGKKKILVDTGINERFIIDGKAWGALPAKGGTKYTPIFTTTRLVQATCVRILFTFFRMMSGKISWTHYRLKIYARITTPRPYRY